MATVFSKALPHSTAADSRSRAASALVVSSEVGSLSFVGNALAERCGLIRFARNASEASELLARGRFDVLVADGRAAGIDAGWLLALRAQEHATPAVVVVRDENQPAFPFSESIAPPFSPDQLLAAVERGLRRRQAVEHAPRSPLDQELARACGVPGIVSHSEAMSRLLAVLERVGAHGSTVLLEGESGTGKEIAARSLHHLSGRPGPFVAINCGSISPELLESELFGHTKGAFTGASQSHQGLFSSANGGTLFLDEIGEMPLAMQAKLLRVLEQRSIRPVGAAREVPVDVRIVTATNRLLAEEVGRGNFRQDLYYRLNVVSLRLPPLRERPSDIAPLIALFSRALAQKLALPEPQLSEQALQRLEAYAWPGNVRELKNLIERALLLDMCPSECLPPIADEAPAQQHAEHGYSVSLPLEEVEKQHILKVLDAAGGNKSEAARRLGVSRKTLDRKLGGWRLG